MKAGSRIHWPSALVFFAGITFLIVILLRISFSTPENPVIGAIAFLAFLGLMWLLVQFSFQS